MSPARHFHFDIPLRRQIICLASSPEPRLTHPVTHGSKPEPMARGRFVTADPAEHQRDRDGRAGVRQNQKAPAVSPSTPTAPNHRPYDFGDQQPAVGSQDF